jgi:DNA primase
MSMWIDFRQLRQDIDLPRLLQHYKVQVRMNGVQGQGFCPLPTHQGQRKSPSFSVNFDRKCWQCFGCKSKGNAIDLAVRMEGHSPGDTRAVREVAEMLMRDFVPKGLHRNDRQPPVRKEAPRQGEAQGRATPPRDARPVGAKPVVVNPPLDFKLQNLDGKHPYLKERHIKPVTVEHFGLGFCSLGMLKGRIAIPLHDAAARLVGYAGRVIDDNLISEENPKYRFPGRRDYQGKVIEFHKSLFLYNGFRVRDARNILVVEGFPSAWWLWQCGYPQVVALMGSSCSTEQAALIVKASAPDGIIWILTDGDDAGDLCVESITQPIRRERKMQRLELGDGVQPTDLSLKELRKLIPIRADKSGTSFKHRVAKPVSKNSAKSKGPMAASS